MFSVGRLGVFCMFLDNLMYFGHANVSSDPSSERQLRCGAKARRQASVSRHMNQDLQWRAKRMHAGVSRELPGRFCSIKIPARDT